MKYIRFALAILFTGALSSCLDSEEKIVINADNSGMYTMSLDLGKMLEMAATMGAKSESEKPKEKKDTVLYLKDLLDSANNLTADEKKIFRDAAINLKLDEEKNEMKLVLSCPFSDMKNLAAIKNNLFDVIKKVKAFEKTTGESAPEEENMQDSKMGMNSVNPVEDQFTFFAAAGKISNTIRDMPAYKSKVANDSSLQMMQQMTGMMDDFKYHTILVLPKAIKKYEGPGSTVSPDKKTVTFETTLTEMMENPEKVSYNVEY